MRLLPWLKAKARYLKLEAHALWLAFRHPRTPWYAKAVLVLVLLYLMSPVDLIPDVIPLLGMLDDLLVLVGGTIPDEDAAKLKEIGVAEVFGPGTPTGEIVEFIRANAPSRAL